MSRGGEGGSDRNGGGEDQKLGWIKQEVILLHHTVHWKLLIRIKHCMALGHLRKCSLLFCGHFTKMFKLSMAYFHFLCHEAMICLFASSDQESLHSLLFEHADDENIICWKYDLLVTCVIFVKIIVSIRVSF